MTRNSARRSKIIVAGAGLGGLTLALALTRRGFEVTVLEQARALGEVGAGVQLSANGTRVLYELGLEPRLAGIAFVPERGEMRHWQTGEVLSGRPLGSSSVERFGFPYFHLHRADLHDALAGALGDSSPGCVRLGCTVTDLVQDERGVRVSTADGNRYQGDVLIGCDGIHSTVRQQLFGRDHPRFTGCVAWRTTIPTDQLPPGHVRPVASNWLGRHGHFVHYYVRGGALVNCVGVIEQEAWLEESWSRAGEPAAFARDFAGWHEDLQVLIRATRRCFRWGLFDRDPMERWTEGRVTLLGDACHPMLPFMAQGAVMAIEDAYTLAACLEAADGSHGAALVRYEQLRRTRTAEVQQRSRDNITFFHNPDAADPARLSGHRSAHEWLYGYDVTALDFAPAADDPGGGGPSIG